MYSRTGRVEGAYLRTAYAVTEARPEVVIRPGMASRSLDALIARNGGRGLAFVTAWNPRGVPRGRMVNGQAQRRLAARLRGSGLRALAGEGRGAGHDWAPEQSLAVFGMSRAGAARLGRALRQNAIVFAVPRRAAELVKLA